jgi:hypothetical protein
MLRPGTGASSSCKHTVRPAVQPANIWAWQVVSNGGMHASMWLKRGNAAMCSNLLVAYRQGKVEHRMIRHVFALAYLVTALALNATSTINERLTPSYSPHARQQYLLVCHDSACIRSKSQTRMKNLAGVRALCAPRGTIVGAVVVVRGPRCAATAL